MPDDAWPIAEVDVASWRAAYRHLMPAPYLDALSVAERAADWQRRLTGQDAERGRRTLIAAEEWAVLGFVRYGPDPDSPADGFIFLLYVSPHRWRTGAGTALMTAAEAALRGAGFATAALGVLEANERARGLYEQLGWRQHGPRQFQDYGGWVLPVVCYRRTLQG